MNRKADSTKNYKQFLKSWEFVLVILLILVFIFDSSLSRKFLKVRNLLDTTQIFMEFAIMTLPLTLIIMTGFIDISIGSITALSSVVMGALFRYGMNIWVAAVFAVLAGLAAGFFNGIIITKLQIPSIVITLATMIFFRGIAYIILEDTVVTGFSGERISNLSSQVN
jgi:rhamnose transport system permease protein